MLVLAELKGMIFVYHNIQSVKWKKWFYLWFSLHLSFPETHQVLIIHPHTGDIQSPCSRGRMSRSACKAHCIAVEYQWMAVSKIFFFLVECFKLFTLPWIPGMDQEWTRNIGMVKFSKFPCVIPGSFPFRSQYSQFYQEWNRNIPKQSTRNDLVHFLLTIS